MQRLRDVGPTEGVEVYSPPFRALTEEAIADYLAIIGASPAKVVWIGLGTPKQDVLAARITSDLGKVAVCVGAAFDFYSGAVKAAPQWLQGSGFEWAYRLIQDPARLWRRYTWGNFRFIQLALKNRTR